MIRTPADAGPSGRSGLWLSAPPLVRPGHAPSASSHPSRLSASAADSGSPLGHHRGMKSRERRDEEAVTIFASLLLFLLVAAAGALVLVLASLFVPLSGDVLNVLVYAVLVCAVVAAGRYVYLHRGR
jgi:hypothetical protein